MSFWFRGLIFTASLFVLIGCGDGAPVAVAELGKWSLQGDAAIKESIDKPEASAIPTEPPELLLVASAGYDSCDDGGPYGTRVNRAFLAILARLRAQSPDAVIHYVVSCLTDDAPPYATAYFYTSANPMVRSIPSGDMVHLVAGMMGGENTNVYLIGHSYGAWQQMNVTVQLDQTYLHALTGLFTIDPISPRDCGPNEISHLFRAGMDVFSDVMTMGFFGTDESSGCRRPPHDVPVNLGEFTRDYLNFFQRDGGYVQSGPMLGAVNKIVPHASHSTIADNYFVWTDIEQAIAADL